MYGKRFFVLFFSLLLVLSVPSFSFARGTKIAVIDMQQIMQQSNIGKATISKLKAKYKALQEKLNQQAKKVQQARQEFEKKAPLLSKEAKQKEEQQITNMIRDLQAQQQNYQMEMRQAEQEAMKPIFAKLKALIHKIGKKKGYAIILEKSMPGVYYVSPKIDITKMIINVLNKETAHKNHKKTKK